MSFVSKLFRRGQQAEPAEKPALGTHEAIQLARQGRISVKEMLSTLVASSLFVPLAAPPEMDGENIKSWKPATVSKGDGSQWLVTFTDAEVCAHFLQQNAGYSHGLRVDARWVLRALPPGHGLVVNMSTPESMFEWNAEGLSRYMAEVGV